MDGGCVWVQESRSYFGIGGLVVPFLFALRAAARVLLSKRLWGHRLEMKSFMQMIEKSEQHCCAVVSRARYTGSRKDWANADDPFEQIVGKLTAVVLLWWIVIQSLDTLKLIDIHTLKLTSLRWGPFHDSTFFFSNSVTINWPLRKTLNIQSFRGNKYRQVRQQPYMKCIFSSGIEGTQHHKRLDGGAQLPLVRWAPLWGCSQSPTVPHWILSSCWAWRTSLYWAGKGRCL